MNTSLNNPLGSDNVVLMRPSIVILTGAGISAESGISTFRDTHGLWENHRLEDVATPEGFERDPKLVLDFYNLRRRALLSDEIQPNAAHLALAEFEKQWNGPFLLVTQNVDDLHERAGSKNILHMHGELLKARCQNSEAIFPWSEDIKRDSLCECCQKPGRLRPHIVWFGEMPFFMDEIFLRLEDCKIFISIGTSGQVYPAAGFVAHTPADALKIEVNTHDTSISRAFDQHKIGLASTEAPRLLNELMQKFQE